MLVTLTRGTHRVEMMKLSTLASMNVSAGVRCRAVACSGRAAGQQGSRSGGAWAATTAIAQAACTRYGLHAARQQAMPV